MKKRLIGFWVLLLFCGFVTQVEAIPIEWGSDRIASLENYLESNLTFFDTQNFEAFTSDTSDLDSISSVDLHHNGTLWMTVSLPFVAAEVAALVDPYPILPPVQLAPLAFDIGNGMPTQAAPVPEPATLLLVGSGMVGLVRVAKKRIKK